MNESPLWRGFDGGQRFLPADKRPWASGDGLGGEVIESAGTADGRELSDGATAEGSGVVSHMTAPDHLTEPDPLD